MLHFIMRLVVLVDGTLVMLEIFLELFGVITMHKLLPLMIMSRRLHIMSLGNIGMSVMVLILTKCLDLLKVFHLPMLEHQV